VPFESLGVRCVPIVPAGGELDVLDDASGTKAVPRKGPRADPPAGCELSARSKGPDRGPHGPGRSGADLGRDRPLQSLTGLVDDADD
jgi:hypothetical protein